MECITIENASFSYNGKDSIWKDVNLKVNEGECFCLLGANGCGKTTLFNCINGNYKLTEGNIYINGKEISQYSINELAKIMGIVYQDHIVSFPYTSLEVVRMGRTPHLGFFQTPSKEDTKIAYEIMEELGIEYLAQKVYSQISGGERQLVLIARTLCQQPQMILFDEPTSHLDFKNQAMVMRILKKLSNKGMTILMTSHFPNHVWKVGTDVALMGNGGIIASGKCEEIMTKEYLEETYSIPVEVIHTKSQGVDTTICEPIMKLE